MVWKYGMLLVVREDDEFITVREDGSRYLQRADEDTHLLVELYDRDDGNFGSFSYPRLNSPEALSRAHQDVQRDGINTEFYDRGRFLWQPYLYDGRWGWERKDQPMRLKEKS